MSDQQPSANLRRNRSGQGLWLAIFVVGHAVAAAGLLVGSGITAALGVGLGACGALAVFLTWLRPAEQPSPVFVDTSDERRPARRFPRTLSARARADGWVLTEHLLRGTPEPVSADDGLGRYAVVSNRAKLPLERFHDRREALAVVRAVSRCAPTLGGRIRVADLASDGIATPDLPRSTPSRALPN